MPNSGARIRADVDRIMSQNRQASTQYPGEWWRLMAITRGRLNQLNHSGQLLGRWLEEHADEIEAHHAALGIEDPTRHNFAAWCHQRTLNGRSTKAPLQAIRAQLSACVCRRPVGAVIRSPSTDDLTKRQGTIATGIHQ